MRKQSAVQSESLIRPAAVGVNIFSRSGARRTFLLNRVPFQKGYFSSNGRVHVTPHRDDEDDIVAGQFAVTILATAYEPENGGKRVPEHQFSLVHHKKGKQRTFARA